MASSSTAGAGARLRRHVYGLAKVYDCHDLDVKSEGRGKWRVTWTDGPSITVVRTSLDREFPDLAEAVRYDREHERRAMVLGALRVAAAASEDDWDSLDDHWLSWKARECLEDVTDPWSGASARERAMVDRLLAVTALRDGWGDVLDEDEYRAIEELVRRRGVGWLLDTTTTSATAPDRQAEPDAVPEGLELTPLELLTVRYAAGPDRRAWVQQARPMPADQALAAATADNSVTKANALAALALVAGLRADLDAAEARITDAARTAGATWSEVGATLGTSEQAAAERRTRLGSTASGNA
ncbi:hypothetical protein [Kitasatospora sp. NBC_01302]|uniref:hypothetical protein n=1 Tax=Kitasatospora sp. NBC_01302 TaxID=2903575 RepID=UPI002E0E6E6B|nr:hypothetical protein OG294_40235 [Kitasatospora sp. NBC_01302]